MYNFDSNSVITGLPHGEDFSSPSSNIQKILFVGENGKYICEKMVDLNYAGLCFKDYMKAYCWLRNLLAKKQPLPDAIICDLELPNGKAFNFLKHVKSIESLKTIPFILITRDASSVDKKKAVKMGCDDIYSLPFTAEDIHTRILFLKQFNKEREQLILKNEISFSRNITWSKRLFDIAVSFVALLLLSPLFLLVAFLIKLESRGPIFYISKRVGTGYKIFDFYKFRSMRVGADAELKKLMHLNQYNDGKGTFVKIHNDPRVTKIGKFLRNTSLDELPQLFNVFKGDMSIVGNRPLPLYEAEQLTKDVWAKRFLAPAGITGLWQVTKRGKKEMSEEERIKLDIIYAKKFSFIWDLKIMLRTIPALFQKEPV